MHLNYGLIPIVSISARMDSAFGIQYWEPIWVTSELRHYITTCINHNFITFIIFQFYLLTLHRFVHSLTKWVKRFESTRCNSGKVFFALNLFPFFPVCGQRTHVCTRRALGRNNRTFWSNVELFLCRYLKERESLKACAWLNVKRTDLIKILDGMWFQLLSQIVQLNGSNIFAKLRVDR